MKGPFFMYGERTAFSFSKNNGLEKKSIVLLFYFLFSPNCLSLNNAIAHSDGKPDGFVDDEDDTTQLVGFKETYIIFGPESGNDNAGNTNAACDLKFQISFKKQLSPPKTLSDSTPILIKKILGRLFFGYTQKSFWDICRDSAPFRESNYNPSLFYENSFGKKNDEIRFLNSYGYEHESNGRAGDISRSWDRIYYQQHIDFGGKTKAVGLKSKTILSMS